MIKKTVVLAYSGGLDTSTILKWLLDKGYDVITFTADIGQIDADLSKIKEKALSLGAKEAIIMDLKKEFVEDYIFPVFSTGTAYEENYLLGTSIARPLIAKYQIKIAKQYNAEYVAHGCTGKGNDQVRFELCYFALKADIKIIVPWRDADFLKQFQGRSDLLKYAAENNIPVSQTSKAPWSEDENLLHISHEAGIIEEVNKEVPKEVYNRSKTPEDAPDSPIRLKIHFDKGYPILVENLNDNSKIEGALEIFQYLNKVGAENGVGHLDMVENRYVGIKSRGIYETPGGTIFHISHRDLEGVCLDREVLKLKQAMLPEFARVIYYGYWFSPEFKLLMNFFDKTQENVTGWSIVKIYKGNCYPVARDAKYSLYDKTYASMDIAGGFEPINSTGFIKTCANRVITNARIFEDKGEPYADYVANKFKNK